METLRPLFWGEGLFLQPQHFQQLDGYHEARSRRIQQLLYPFGWGIKSLSIDETALQNFQVEIEHCELVTPEGTILRFQMESAPSNARIVPRSCEDALDPGGAPLGVYLGLKRLQWEGGNLEMPSTQRQTAEGDAYPRFRLHEVMTPDLFVGEAQSQELQYLIYDVRMLFDGDPIVYSHDYELIKIAEIQRAAEDQGAILAKRYIPPVLDCHASPVLHKMLREIRDMLTAKGGELSDYKHKRGVHTVDLGSRDTVYLLMMQMVNRYIPLFHHHLEVRETPPCVFYALLRQFIGELSTFSDTVSVLGGPLPPYRHDQLWECFNAAVEVARTLIYELTKGPEYVVPLEFDGEYYAANLDQRVFEAQNRHYLSVKTDVPTAELQHHLADVGKVGTRQEMESLRNRSLPGLSLRYLENPPGELPRRAHSTYFEIDHHGTLWSSIMQRQNIAVYCKLPPEDTQIELLIVD